MQILKFLIFGIFILGININLFANPCNLKISGKAININSQSPIPFVKIQLNNSKSTLSDSLGNFSFGYLCAEIYQISIISTGFDRNSYKINLRTDTVLDFYFSETTKILNELEIHNHQDYEIGSISKTEISEKNLFAKSGGNISDLINGVSGVSILKTGSTISKPIIRGLHSNRILVLNNGVRQEGQNWGNEHAPEIDPYIASKVTVLKGPASAKYGSDALAGALLIETPNIFDSVGLRTELNSAYFFNGKMGVLSGIVGFRKNKFSPFAFRIQSTVKKGGNVSTPTYFQENTGVNEFNQSAEIGFKKKVWGISVFASHFKTKLGILKSSHVGNLTDLKNILEQKNQNDSTVFSYSINRPYQSVSHTLLKNKFYLLNNKLGKFEVLYAVQQNNREEYDKNKSRNDSLAALNLPELDFRLTSHSLDLNWEHKKVLGWQGFLGSSFTNQYNIYLGRNLIPNFQNISLGIFAIEHFRKENYELEWAIRFDKKYLNVYERNTNNEIVNTKLHFQRPSVSLGFAREILNKSTITFNLSSAWRAPSVNELFSNGIHQSKATFEMGNKQLLPEYSYASSFDFNFEELKWLKFKGGFFAQQINNFIFLLPVQPPVLLIQGAFPTFRYFQTDAFLYGLDFHNDILFNRHFAFESSFSLVRAKDLKNKGWIYGIPSDRADLKLITNPWSRGNLKNVGITVSSTLVAKQIRVPAAIDYLAPPNAYGLLNSEISWMVNFNKTTQLFLIFGANNILNKQYREYLNSFRYFTNEMGRNFYLKIKLTTNNNHK